MTLKIRSRSPKSNLLFPFSQQYIFASLVKIHPLFQKITHETILWTFQSAIVTLKIRSTSPKSNQLFPSSQLCIYASLVKIHQLVQKIMHGNKKVKADANTNADGIRTKNNISPHPLGWGDILINKPNFLMNKRKK